MKKRKSKAAGKKKTRATRPARRRRRITDESVFGLDQAQLKMAFYHGFIDCDWESPRDPADPSHFYGISLRDLGKRAAEYLGAEEVEAVFRSTPPVVLWKRYWLVEYLKSPTTPIYTTGQLAGHVESYRAHLAAQKRGILKDGYPRRRFSPCPWLDNRLSPTLPDEVTVLPSGFVEELPERKRVAWPWQADELAAARGKLNNVRHDVLAVCGRELGNGDADVLVRDVIEALTLALLKSEARQLVEAERIWARARGGGSDISKAGWPLSMTGGLSALLLTVGHFAKELAIGTYGRTAERLQEVGVDVRRASSYFALVDDAGAAAADEALDRFWVLDKLEAPFWKRYGRIVEETFQSRFDVSVRLRAHMPRKLAVKYGRLLQKAVDLQAEHLRSTGRLLDIGRIAIGPFAGVAPPGDPYVHEHLCRAALSRPEGFTHGELVTAFNKMYAPEKAVKSTVTNWLLAMCEASVLARPRSRKERYTFKSDFL